ncbi:MAG: PCP reductase family protein [Myxococcales bacterium]|nr:PCP reductase family protein [Myxococcales bacterium]MDD9966897.1 PCP reductase family protein [Myxococcales bacterium]
MDWQPEALARLKRAPFFIRPFIKKRAEAEARARGLRQVTAELLDQLKSAEHAG